MACGWNKKLRVEGDGCGLGEVEAHAKRDGLAVKGRVDVEIVVGVKKVGQAAGREEETQQQLIYLGHLIILSP